MTADGLLPEDTKVRSSKYLNNVIEQDHRHIKSRTNVMLGSKRFRSAAITISGIELTHRIRKENRPPPHWQIGFGNPSISYAQPSLNTIALGTTHHILWDFPRALRDTSRKETGNCPA
jgi:hypothetical protein